MVAALVIVSAGEYYAVKTMESVEQAAGQVVLWSLPDRGEDEVQ